MLYQQTKEGLCKQLSQKGKILVAVLTISISMTDMKIEGELEELEWVSCIQYPITFKDQIEVLLDLESEVNVMSQAFAQQLSLKICKTNVGAQKIDSTTL